VKVGFLSQPFDYAGPLDPGGSIGIWTWETARRLARSCGVTVFGPRPKGGPKDEQWEDVRFHRSSLNADHWRGMLMRRLRAFVPPPQGPDFASAAYYPIYASRAAKAFRDEACDVIHIHQYSQFVPIIRAINPRAKIVLHMHSDWLVQLDREMIDRRLQHADAIIGCSDYVVSHIREGFPHYSSRCATVFNGVDIERVTPGIERPPGRRPARVIFVGRVSPEKGLHVLLEAFGRVLDQYPEADLEIIGGEFVAPFEYIVGMSDDPMVKGLSRFYGGSYLASLRGQVKGKLEGHVSFLGHIPRADMIEHMRQADLFVQPSIASEMFGMATAEAMAAGIPVIATRICGLPEVVADGETGLLISPDDPGAMASAIVRLLGDAKLSAQMGRAGRTRAEQMFSWDSTVASLEHLYTSLHSGAPLTGATETIGEPGGAAVVSGAPVR
jgi:glycosyltransferase involved in cell wall biosynthesis